MKALILSLLIVHLRRVYRPICKYIDEYFMEFSWCFIRIYVVFTWIFIFSYTKDFLDGIEDEIREKVEA